MWYISDLPTIATRTNLSYSMSVFVRAELWPVLIFCASIPRLRGSRQKARQFLLAAWAAFVISPDVPQESLSGSLSQIVLLRAPSQLKTIREALVRVQQRGECLLHLMSHFL